MGKSIKDYEVEALEKLFNHLESKDKSVTKKGNISEFFLFDYDGLLHNGSTNELIPVEVALGGRLDEISSSQMDKFIVDALRLLWADRTDVNQKGNLISQTRYLILKSKKQREIFLNNEVGKKFMTSIGPRVEIFSADLTEEEDSHLRELHAKNQEKK